MRLKITVSGNACKSVAEKVGKMGTVEDKEFEGNSLSMVGLFLRILST